ncbi:hypothetical protein AB0D32_20445 [Micromonospora sp. NPDC048170]|uniref:sulfurtransferase TusA family protein n=1 Tax=Micromonospora sp. NPDC048170 TaxID=3154819 RepID=UPI0033E3051B
MQPVHAVVDAGGESWPRVRDVLERHCHRLPPGCVVELLTEDPAVPGELGAWCAAGGAELLATDETGVPVVLRIRTGGSQHRQWNLED